MAYSLAQVKTGVNTTFASSVSSTAFANALTNGSLIVVWWEGDAVALNGANAPTDTALNVYTRAGSVAVAATFDLECWYTINTHTTAANIVTVTDNGGGVDSIVIVQEWTGNKSSAPIDGSSTNTGTLSPLTSGSFSTTHNNDLISVGGVEAVAASDLTAGAGYTNLTQANTAFSNLGTCSQVGGIAAYNGTFTSSVGVSWACAAIAFKDSATDPVVHFFSLLNAGG